MVIEWKLTRGRLPLDLALLWYLLLASVIHFQCSGSSRFPGSMVGPVEEHVCSSIDIRNSVSNFYKLDNCTVIEGYLRILLIDWAETSHYINLTYPKLREITGYFLLFRVKALTSVKNLFPNLSVIRGSELFHNFAFVVYEMLELEKIELPSLTNIMRGSVRIEKNPKLCYLNTIDWGPIATNTHKDDHFIDSNGKSDECPDKCNEMCPKNSDNVQFCWNNMDCQKMCDVRKCGNRTCMSDGTCCHESCLGGCRGATQVDCFVCRRFRFNGACMDHCPPKTYEYHDRRCLSDSECLRMSKNTTNKSKPVNFKIFRGVCTSICPNGFTEDSKDPHSCKKCDGPCPRVCNGGTVSSIADVQNLKECTIIDGPLEIQVSGGENVVKELEDSLKMVEEITGYLKVARSFPLKSLNFLKSLQKIGMDEKKLNDGRYALYVLDNHNLENLWDWGSNSTSTLQILHGKLFFHFNPKLCVDKIRQLEKIANLPISDTQDVSTISNGDQIACNVSTLDLRVVEKLIDKYFAVVHFTNFLKKKTGEIDWRSLLGYMISYKEVPEGEVNLFDDYDSCAANSWKVIDVMAHDSSFRQDDDMIAHLVPNLKPYTRYGIYVKTYTIASEKHGGKSRVIYFRTKAHNPTPPADVTATPISSRSLLVSWKPPLQPNGNVTHYRVTLQLEDFNREVIYSGDYCGTTHKSATEPVKNVPPLAIEDVIEKNKTDSSESKDSDCCPCSKDEVHLKEQEYQQKLRIEFEDFLHNIVYQKRDSDPQEQLEDEDNAVGKRALRKRRALLDTTAHKYLPEANLILTLARPYVSSINSNENAEFGGNNSVEYNCSHINVGNTSLSCIVREKTSEVIPSLKHFSKYIIRVIACHDETSNETLCSSEAIISARTKPKFDADDINQTSIHIPLPIKNANSVFVKWESPPNPNGLILSFYVETRRADGSHNPSTVCVSYAEYLNGSGAMLPPLQSGNYSLRLQAISMAGPGNWTAPCYFYIPEPSSNFSPAIIGGIIVGVVAIVALIAGVTYNYIKKKYYNNATPAMHYTSVNPEYLSAGDVYVPDDWEIDREKINLLRELGQGSFGMVYEGEFKDSDSGDKSAQPCAVKTVNESASLRERIEFLNEASVMKAFTCNHVVRLIGVVSKGHPTYVVMELMRNGDLKTFLRVHRPDQQNPATQPPSVKRILQMAIEIADGMSYLADKKYVHRDLAARNCMVAHDLTVKIGDFGMTRDIYETDYYRKGGKGLLPVRWMAPESLKDGVFTSQSDVWSFGVVLWEMATLASQPYQGLSNEQVLKYVIEGGVMEKPENCLAKLYELMRDCWHYNPTSRPTFQQLIESLLPDAQPSFLEVSFYFAAQERARGAKERMEADEEDGQEVTPSTPLRTPEDGRGVAFHVGYALDSEHETDFRPKSHSKTWSSRPPSQPQTSLCHVNEGSKGISISSSDGSKDSKTSTCSANGSIVNGRVGMQWSKGMEC